MIKKIILVLVVLAAFGQLYWLSLSSKRELAKDAGEVTSFSESACTQKVHKKVIDAQHMSVLIPKCVLEEGLGEAFYTKARIVPNVADGASAGLKFLKIDEGSFFDQLGVQALDVLKQVNEQNIESKDVPAFIDTFKRSPKGTLTVLRGQEQMPVQINFEVY